MKAKKAKKETKDRKLIIDATKKLITFSTDNLYYALDEAYNEIIGKEGAMRCASPTATISFPDEIEEFHLYFEKVLKEIIRELYRKRLVYGYSYYEKDDPEIKSANKWACGINKKIEEGNEYALQELKQEILDL